MPHRDLWLSVLCSSGTFKGKVYLKRLLHIFQPAGSWHMRSWTGYALSLLLPGGSHLLQVICIVCWDIFKFSPFSNAKPGYCYTGLILYSAGTLVITSLLQLMIIISLMHLFSYRWETRDCVIVHPGAVCVMVRLLPKLYKEGHSQVSLRVGPCEFCSNQSVFPTCVLVSCVCGFCLQSWMSWALISVINSDKQ